MREFEQSFPDWRQQVESARFYDTRKGDVTSGTQHAVYTTRGIDFVIKVPTDPIWQQGYWLVEELAPEMAVPFIRVEGLKITVNHHQAAIPEAIVQTKARLLDTAIATKGANPEELIQEQIEADKKLTQKGIFVPDPNFGNYGIEKSGEVKRFDFGDARISFTGAREYSGLARARAGSHYVNLLFLQALGLNKLREQYAEAFSLPPVPIEISTFEKLEKSQSKASWNPDVAVFLGRIGHQEFQQYAPNGAPFELNENALRGLASLL